MQGPEWGSSSIFLMPKRAHVRSLRVLASRSMALILERFRRCDKLDTCIPHAGLGSDCREENGGRKADAVRPAHFAASMRRLMGCVASRYTEQEASGDIPEAITS